MIRIAAALLLFALTAPLAVAAPPEDGTRIARAENFRLNDHRDASHELYRLVDAEAVVLFTYGVGCPIVRQSVPELKRLDEMYTEKGVRFLLLDGNAHGTREEVAEDAKEFGVPFPILVDPAQTVIRNLGITRTAEAILIDPQDDWKILYRGALDDRMDYGTQKQAAENTWLRDALDAHLAGEAIATTRSEVKGCKISVLEKNDLSYSEDVAPILAEKCAGCHRSGAIGPFALNGYKKVLGWTDMIAETIRTKRMPPWHADPAYSRYHNDLSLSVEEERTLLSWIEAGAERGEGPDPLEDLPPHSNEGWTLGEPDLIVEMAQPEELPAEGTIDYRYIYVDAKLNEDKWVRAAQVKPSNPAVLHHCLIFILYPEQYQHVQPDNRGGLSGYFEAFLPGTEIEPYPEGTGQFVPAGSIFVFQMHYNATGKPETDQTQMALYFHDETPAEALTIDGAFKTRFRIPPHEKDHPASATFKVEQDMRIWGVSPHMHYRGSRARFDAVQPDGAMATLLNVPYYDFDWQPMYLLDQPFTLAKGSRIEVSGAWDNSPTNPANPDPEESVEFGNQSWEEMFIGFVKKSVPIDEELYTPRPVEKKNSGEKLTKETLVGTEWDIMGRYQITIAEDGVLNMGTMKVGRWEMRDDLNLNISAWNRELTVLVRGDELLANGRKLKRLK